MGGKLATSRLPDEYYEIANEYDLKITEADETPGLFDVRTDDGKDVTDDPVGPSDLWKFLVAFEIGYLRCIADAREDAPRPRAQKARP
jgi:hypothetical protein